MAMRTSSRRSAIVLCCGCIAVCTRALRFAGAFVMSKPLLSSAFPINNLGNIPRTLNTISPNIPIVFTDGPTLLNAVEIFDGSSIVDPTVVSSVFWTSLKAKLISVIIGQILATIVFVAISTAAASQLPRLGELIGGLINDNKIKVGSTLTEFSSVEQTIKQRAGQGQQGLRKIQPDVGKLLLCLLIDTLGTSSELIPFVGEVTDVVWAPIAALSLRSLYGSNTILALEFLEEILPFTDIVPLATICWGVETFAPDGNLARTFGIGSYGINGGTVIDVPSSNSQQGMDRRRYYLDSGKETTRD